MIRTRSNLPLKRYRAKWAIPLWKEKRRLRGAKGGRSSGKSHEMAEAVVERMALTPSYSTVCIREIQKTLQFSAKRLIENKIRSMGMASLFEIQASIIKRRGGTGVCIFQGMQDHNADSIKSLEDFDLAWVEEAQTLSQRSIDLLIPTIRKDGSEIWFSWNPEQPTDPVEELFAGEPDDSVCVHVNYLDNKKCPDNVIKLADDWRRRRPDTFDHVWLGEFNTKSEDQVLAGRWRVDEFEPQDNWDGPYFGADWGFSVDPSTLLCVYIHNNTLYVRRERYGHQIEINDLPEFFAGMPGSADHVIRGDNSRPETISYLQKHGYPKCIAAPKWQGSVEDGISTLRGFDEIIIHPECEHTIDEARLWKYKRDRLTGDILPKLIDGNDHCWDAIRYALAPIIQQGDNMEALLRLAIR